MNSDGWTYNKEMKWHTKQVPNRNAFVFTYKTAGGDYAVSAMRENDIAGGLVEYLLDLRKAKRFAETLLLNDLWKDYTLNG